MTRNEAAEFKAGRRCETLTQLIGKDALDAIYDEGFEITGSIYEMKPRPAITLGMAYSDPWYLHCFSIRLLDNGGLIQRIWIELTDKYHGTDDGMRNGYGKELYDALGRLCARLSVLVWDTADEADESMA